MRKILTGPPSRVGEAVRFLGECANQAKPDEIHQSIEIDTAQADRGELEPFDSQATQGPTHPNDTRLGFPSEESLTKATLDKLGGLKAPTLDDLISSSAPDKKLCEIATLEGLSARNPRSSLALEQLQNPTSAIPDNRDAAASPSRAPRRNSHLLAFSYRQTSLKVPYLY